MEISRHSFVVAIIGVCILSAGIGSGITLLAKTGPEGPAGERGPTGPRGAQGPEGSVDVDEIDIGFLESEVGELREEVEGLEWLEGDLGSVESQISGVESTVSNLCFELDVYC